MLLTWIRFFIIIKKVIGTILYARLGSLHELFTHLSASRSFHNSIISLLEFHCLPANTTRPNKMSIVFPPPPLHFYCFLPPIRHHHISTFFLRRHQISTVFLLPPQQFYCFSPSPLPPQFYCFPASTTTILLFPPPTPPPHLLFPCSFHPPFSITILLFSLHHHHHHISISFLLFCHHHHMGRINFLKDLAFEQFSPRKSQLQSRKAEIFALLFVPPDRKSIRASPRRKLKSHSFRAFKMRSQLHKVPVRNRPADCLAAFDWMTLNKQMVTQ